MAINNGFCCMCGAKGEAYLRLDKKGNPYTGCDSCHTRMFIHNQRVLDFVSHLMSTGLSFEAIALRAGWQPAARAVQLTEAKKANG